MRCIFEMVLRNAAGERLALSSEDFHCHGDVWTHDDLKMKACVEICENGKRLKVENEGGCVLEQVRWPICERQNSSQYDQLLFASAWGDNLHEPSQTIRRYWEGRNTKSDAYQYIKCAPNEIRYLYPSVMAMQFVTLYNDAQSFYLASYSMGDDSIFFCAKALKGPCALELSILHSPYLRCGQWVSPVCESAELGPGWHPACERYMARMGGAFQNPDWPAWMKAEETGFHGWVQIPMKYRDRPALCRYADLPQIYREKVVPLGLNAMHVFGWCNEGHDTLYCDYFPNPELGTAEELRAACEEIKAMGGHVILYANGRLYSLKSRLGIKHGERPACKDEKGAAYNEVWGPQEHYLINCPTETAFHEELFETVRRYITEYGANAAQVDQISCNFGEFCFDASHRHTTPANNFLPGVERELMGLRKVHKALDPDFFVWCEGCHERFGQHYDVEQGHGETYSWQVGESLPEQFQYCWKDRIVTGLGRNIHQLCHSMLQGKPLDVTLAALEDADFADALRRMIDLRRRYPEFYLNGRFMDDEGVETDRATRSGVLLSPDGKRMLVALWRRGTEKIDTEVNAWLRIKEETGEMACIFPSACAAMKEAGGWMKISFRGPFAALIFDRKP